MKIYLIVTFFLLSFKIYPYADLPEDIIFAGQKIDTDQFQVKERISKELIWFTKDRVGYLHQLFHDLEYYKDLIYPIFDKYKIDRDYIFVAAVESSFDFRRVSTRRASGPWQFMKSTGKMYGLVVNRYIDERNHPVKATEAFCKHIKKLNNSYKGDPVKILSAYNSGEKALNESLIRQNSDSFWETVSNNETSRYFTKILTLKLIYENYEDYDIDIDISGDSFFAKYEDYSFTLSERVKFVDFCSVLGITYREFYHANPHLKHDGYRKGGVLKEAVNYSLFVPKGSSKLLDTLFAPKSETVKGDTIFVDVENRSIGEIALLYGKSWREIAAENGLEILIKDSGVETVDLSEKNRLIIVK
jgi:hypothetical protein